MRRCTLLVAVVAVSLVFVLTLGSSSAGSATSAPKVVLTIGVIHDMDSLNPFVAQQGQARSTYVLTYDSLLRYDRKTLKPVPGLAESWTTSQDQLTWTFKIRKGVKWSDGQPLTAHDIAYTYSRILANKSALFVSSLPYVVGATAPSDDTLLIVTSKPTPRVLSAFIPVLPEHIWKSVSAKEEQTYSNANPVGSGPFRFVEWKNGQYWRLEANKDYWGGQPHVDELLFRVFNDPQAMVLALQSGEIDVADEIPPNIAISIQSADIKLWPQSGASYFYVGINCGAGDGHPALRDVRVRQAINWAVDRKALLDRVLRGYGTIGTTIIPPLLQFYHADPQGDQVIGFDLARARALLDNAGYRDVNGDGVREMPNGGKSLVFRYFARTERPASATEAALMQGWLKQIGIRLKITSITDNKLIEDLANGNFDLESFGWATDLDPTFLLSVFTSSQAGNLNDAFYKNKTYDAQYEEQNTLTDLAQRAELVDRMQMEVYDDCPYVVLYYEATIVGYRTDRFVGFLPSPDTKNGYILTHFAYTNDSLLNVRPVGTGVGTTSTGTTGVWVVIGIVIALLVVAAAVFVVRRRSARGRA